MIDPIQSIRVATNLTERFRTLVSQTHSGFGELGINDLELKIGEAQQIYPEIWRHLEDARGVLVERGRDVTSFDVLRGAELVKLGVTDIDVKQQINYAALMMGRLRYQTVKTATFNVAGYQRAVAACRALMSAMPEVDWVALAKAEDKEIAAVGSLQSAVWLGAAKWVVIMAALGGAAFGAYKLFTRGGDPEVNAAREKELAEAREETDLRIKVAERKQAIRAARAAYEDSCDPKQRDTLIALLRDDSQLGEAERVVTTPCKPHPPRFSEGRDAAQARILDKFELVDDGTGDYIWRCAGGFFGKDRPGLAVALTAKTKAGKKVTIRGVVSRDGTADLTAPAPWPHEISAIDAGDLDADGIDEVVAVYAQGVAVSRVRDGRLADVADLPVLGIEPTGHACTGSIQLDPDPEKPTGSRLMIDVDEGAKDKGCPKPGLHAFVLSGDKLVDAAPPE